MMKAAGGKRLSVRRIMRGMARVCALAGVLALGLFVKGEQALARGCDERFLNSGFYRDESGNFVFDTTALKARAMIMDTPVYKRASGDEVVSRLSFNQQVAILDPGIGRKRIKIGTLTQRPLGWVDRKMLFCALYPLVDRDTGLYRRVYINTGAEVRGQGVVRPVYHSPDGRCEGGSQNCPTVSRYQTLYIYAERNNRLLLSFDANLKSPMARFYGWLDKEYGILWNTAAALRPKVELAERRPTGPLPPVLEGRNVTEDFVCVYRKREQVGDIRHCQPVFGGDIWFELETRLPILEDRDGIYKVAFSGGSLLRQRDNTRTIREQQVMIKGLSKLDVMFVIDGTRSMQPVIDAIRGTRGQPGLVEQLDLALREKVREGGKYRLSFRIYRDSNRTLGNGVTNSEAYVPYDPDCEIFNNGKEFHKRFRRVMARDVPGDNDNEENLFGALVQVARDMRTCPGYSKLIIVIGDHGYNPEAQRRRGFPAYTIEHIARRFRKGALGDRTPTILFIQVPSQERLAQNPTKYRQSYYLFEEQARAILRAQVVDDPELARQRSEALFYRLDPGRLSRRMIHEIVSRLDSVFIRPSIQSEIAQRLEGGESIRDIIKKLRGRSSINVPGWFWDTLERDVCAQLGDRCNSSNIVDLVGEGYIAHSDKLARDILISQDEADKWINILESFTDYRAATGRRARERLKEILIGRIERVTRQPRQFFPSRNDPNQPMSIGEYLQLKGSLPGGFESPMLAYSLEELEDPQRVPDCEIELMKTNARMRKDMLFMATSNDTLTMFREIPPSPRDCPGLSPKGKRLRLVDPRSMRMRILSGGEAGTQTKKLHLYIGNTKHYWIPVRYLP